jgi:hypothetical protein
LGRTGHARRAEVIVNGCRDGSGGTLHAPRVVLEGDDVSARSRCIERHRHRTGRGVLRDSFRLSNTVRVKHIVSPVSQGKHSGEVARRDRLSDREDIVSGWHRHFQPIEEHARSDLVDLSALNAV